MSGDPSSSDHRISQLAGIADSVHVAHTQAINLLERVEIFCEHYDAWENDQLASARYHLTEARRALLIARRNIGDSATRMRKDPAYLQTTSRPPPVIQSPGRESSDSLGWQFIKRLGSHTGIVGYIAHEHSIDVAYKLDSMRVAILITEITFTPETRREAIAVALDSIAAYARSH